MLPTKQAAALLNEFKAFALKGNVIDLAVGVIIGGAFGKLVTSLVENVIMPIINLFVPGPSSYVNWAFEISGKQIPYGKFLADTMNFLIVSFALFIFIRKFLVWAIRVKEEAPPPAAPTREETLLTEIRDILKAKQVNA